MTMRAANGQAGRTRSLGARVGEVGPVQRVQEVLKGVFLIFVCLLAAAAPSDPTIASKGQQVGMRWRLDVKETAAQLRGICCRPRNLESQATPVLPADNAFAAHRAAIGHLCARRGQQPERTPPRRETATATEARVQAMREMPKRTW